MDTAPLERIGLTQGEIKVYLALLKLGQSTAGPIVDESRVTRSKIYDILERLKQKGMISFITKKSTKYFNATAPNNIIGYLEEKEKEIAQEKKSIEMILPKLLVQHALTREKNIAELFTGIKGMKNAFETIAEEFDSKHIYYSFGASEGTNTKQVQLFFTKFNKLREQKKVKAKIIFNESSRGLFPSQEKSKLVETRYIDHSTPAAINIYKDYTIIALLTSDIITILIRNKEVADSFLEYYKTILKISRK